MKVTDFLDAQGVKYEMHQHRPAFTAQQMAAEEHVPGIDVAKPVLIRADKTYYLCVLPACCKIDMDALKTVLNAGRIALADEEELAKVFGDCALGAEPPFGHLYDVKTLLDETLSKEPKIMFQAGTHELAIRMNTDDFIRLENPQVTAYSYHMQ